MKVRNGFVTNSSSTNFGASSMSAILAVLAGILTGDTDDNIETSQEKKEPTDALVVKFRPVVNTIELENTDPVSVFAQVRKKDEMGVWQNDQEATENIQFTFTYESEKWVTTSDTVFDGYYKAIAFIAESPYKDLPQKQRPKCPTTLTLVITATSSKGDPLRRTFKFKLIGEPSLHLEPYKLTVLSGTDQTETVQIKMDNSRNQSFNYSFNYLYSSENYVDCQLINDESGTTLHITPKDIEIPKNSTYEKAILLVSAQSDLFYCEDQLEVNVCKEGLYYLSEQPISIDAFIKEDAFDCEVVTFELRIAKWNEETKQLEYKAELLKDVVFEDIISNNEQQQYLIDSTEIEINQGELVINNVSSGKFNIQAKQTIPVRFKQAISAKIISTISFNDEDYVCEIPLEIHGEYIGDEEIQKEYENCVYIIQTYYPENGKAAKLKELETYKLKPGIHALRFFREQAWSECCDAFMQEADTANRNAMLLSGAIYTSEVLRFMGDRAFSFVAASLTSPFGAFVAGQIRDTFVGFVVACMNSEKEGMEFVSEYLWARVLPTASGTIDSAFSVQIDYAKNTENKSLLAKYLVAMFFYKWGWHYFITKNEEGTEIPLGIVGALQLAIRDLSGVGVELALGDFMSDALKTHPEYFKTIQSKVSSAANTVVNTLTDEEFVAHMQKTIIAVCINK